MRSEAVKTAPTALSATVDAACEIRVQTKSGEFAFQAMPGDTLLYAGLQQGLTLPYACATGTCGSCRARVMIGEVEQAWNDAPGGAQLKREKGDILLCQTRAVENCVLRVPAIVAPRPERHQIPAQRVGTLENKRWLTGDVVSFEVTLSEPMTLDAGQFVVMNAPGITGARAYSMVGFERLAQRVEFVVKRKPGGGFSDWLFESAVEGERLDIFGPLGQATFHPEEDRNLLMIAGGSGIAGIMSILARSGQEGYFRRHKGYVFFGVRTLADGFYLADFARHLADAGGNLEVTLAVSHEDLIGESHPQYPEVSLASGMVHEVAARVMKGRYDEVMAYIAGPPPMVDGALRVLIEAELSPASIRFDKFG